jgi:Bacteriophage protein gp37
MLKERKREKFWDEGVMAVKGCTPCSPGCRLCWSAAWQYRFQKGNSLPGEVPGRLTYYNGEFRGKVELDRDRLEKAIRRQKKRVVAIWNDVFHDDVPFEFVQRCLHLAEQGNTLLLITKRPQRAVEFFEWLKTSSDYVEGLNKWRKLYVGLTVCNQEEANQKIPVITQIQDYNLFLNIEPMLGEIDLGAVPLKDSLGGLGRDDRVLNLLSCFDGVIVGPENGQGSRPMNGRWVRMIENDCRFSNTPFFFKGWGDWVTTPKSPLEKSKGSAVTKMYIDGVCHDWGDDTMALRIGKKSIAELTKEDEFPSVLPWWEALAELYPQPITWRRVGETKTYTWPIPWREANG